MEYILISSMDNIKLTFYTLSQHFGKMEMGLQNE